MENEKFVKAFVGSNSISELAKKLGYIRPNGSRYKEIKRLCEEHSLDYNSLSKRHKDGEYDEKLVELVPRSKSLRDVIGRLGLNQDSGTISARIRNRIVFLGIDTSHFVGSNWNKGKTRFTDTSIDLQAKSIEIPWKEAFKKGSKTQNHLLMKRLALSGKRKYECSICHLRKWNGKPIRLRLDHVDGDNTNNAEENLRFLCPNCDSQTPTFCRGIRGRSSKIQWWQIID